MSSIKEGKPESVKHHIKFLSVAKYQHVLELQEILDLLEVSIKYASDSIKECIENKLERDL